MADEQLHAQFLANKIVPLGGGNLLVREILKMTQFDNGAVARRQAQEFSAKARLSLAHGSLRFGTGTWIVRRSSLMVQSSGKFPPLHAV